MDAECRRIFDKHTFLMFNEFAFYSKFILASDWETNCKLHTDGPPKLVSRSLWTLELWTKLGQAGHAPKVTLEYGNILCLIATQDYHILYDYLRRNILRSLCKIYVHNFGEYHVQFFNSLYLQVWNKSWVNYNLTTYSACH